MPHSLRVRLKNLQRKGELTETDIDRIFKALEQVSEIEENIIKYMKKYPNHVGNADFWEGFYACRNVVLQLDNEYSPKEQEPISVSVSEKEPDEISEEVTLRFFRNTLKVRWQDLVIYNVEWLKKNWQMEMDIVCGVKPCDDVVSRQAVLDCLTVTKLNMFDVTLRAREEIKKLPFVAQKLGKWEDLHRCWVCSECGQETHIEHKYCPNCGARMVKPQESDEISERNMKMWQDIFEEEKRRAE